MKGDYTPARRKPDQNRDKDHPQMKGDYTRPLGSCWIPVDKDHPQMKGDYTQTHARNQIEATKTTPK